MLDFYPVEIKKKFIDSFIREVLLNTSSANFYFLEELISRKEAGLGKGQVPKLGKEEIKEIVKDYYDKSPRERVREYFRETGDKVSFEIDFGKYDQKGNELVKSKEILIKQVVPRINHATKISPKQILRIPESHFSLPPRFRNLQPTRTIGKISLGRLNVFLNDKNVKSIECSGAGKSIFVNGLMGRKPTNFILSEHEINDIINNFSNASKIPVEEGVFKVAFGNLVLTSTISSSGSNFLIQKI